MKKPRTLKYIIPGEVLSAITEYVTESGEVIRINKMKSLVVPSKKNKKQIVKNAQTGQPHLVDSEHFKRWKAATDKIFEAWYVKLFEDKSIRLPIVRCNLKVLFYYPDSLGRDAHNKYETICDMLSLHGIIADDSSKVLNNESTRGVVRRDNPRTEIYITILEPGHEGYEWDETPPEYFDMMRARKAAQRRIHRDKKKKQARSVK